jgi:hypothetical protein
MAGVVEGLFERRIQEFETELDFGLGRVTAAQCA